MVSRSSSPRASVKKCFSHEGCANGTIKGVFVLRTARGLYVAATRGAPTKPSRGAFASRTARGLNIAATRDAQTQPGGEVFVVDMAWGLNIAATRGAPNKCRREDSVAGTWHSPPFPPQATTRPLSSSRVPLPEEAVGKLKSTGAICKLT